MLDKGFQEKYRLTDEQLQAVQEELKTQVHSAQVLGECMTGAGRNTMVSVAGYALRRCIDGLSLLDNDLSVAYGEFDSFRNAWVVATFKLDIERIQASIHEFLRSNPVVKLREAAADIAAAKPPKPKPAPKRRTKK